MTNFRSGFTGAVLKIFLCSIVFLLLLSQGTPAKDNPKTKTLSQKVSARKKPLQGNSQKKKDPKAAPSKKNALPKPPVRKITVVMENYPPNCYIENPPKTIKEEEFRTSILKKLKGKAHRDILLSVYHLDKKARKYILSDKLSREKLEEILLPTGFLNITGFEIEISKAVFASLGIEPEYKVYPWARCLEMMKTGKSDAILTIFRNNERMKYLYYPQEFTVDQPNVLFKLKESKITFDGDLKKLKKYVFGVKSSTAYGSSFDRADYLRKEEVPFTESVISLVENKRVSLGVGSVILLKHLLKQKGIAGKFTLLKPYISQEHLYIAFSKARKQKQLSEEYSEKLSKFKRTDKYKKILKQYGVANP